MTYLQISFFYFKRCIKGVIHSIYPDVLLTYSADSMKEIDFFLKNHLKDD